MVEWRSVCFTLGIVALCFVVIPIKIDKDNELEDRLNFNSYIKLYNKLYNVHSEEYENGFRNFKNSRKHSEELNRKRNSSDLAFYGFTKFADISKEDFKTLYLKGKHGDDFHKKYNNFTSLRHPVLAQTNSVLRTEYLGQILPKIVDWRARGIVSKVKNQGTCGACWAFSTVSTIESMAALKSGKLQEFSVQEMIDCAGNGNFGCNGGDTCNLLEWLVDNSIKIESEKDYPLLLHNHKCKYNKNIDGVQIASNYTCNSFVGNENDILSILANHGPVAVAVNAISWQYYLGGVIRFHCDGSLENLNHAVTIVGYDLTASTPYYLIKNSWGTSFGERGYLKIAVGENVCGIANEVAIMDII